MIEFKAITSMETWNTYVLAFDEANFLQSWQWGQSHEATGMVVIRQTITKHGKVVGLFSGIIKDARRGRYLEIPGGPLVDWSDSDVVRAARTQLRKIALEHNCVFIRIRPQAERSEATNSILTSLGFRPAPMHLHAEDTSIISLENDEATLLDSMRQQTRYEVRRVAKRGVIITTSRSKKSIDEFYELQHSTAHRQNFVAPTHASLSSYQLSFEDNLTVYKAEKDGILLNLGLVISFGKEADYFEAASTVESRKEPGAYGIIWQSIIDAKQAGMTRYNLWGIAPDNIPNHRYRGVTIFKRGFGGKDVHFTQSHDLVINPIRYKINYIVETVRKKRRKL